MAPEPQLEQNFRKLKQLEYVTADLFDPRAMLRMDICDIQLPDDSFDAIYCSHVLEHVDDDRRAMSEFLRVLRPGGWAILNVPVVAEKTFEDPSVTDPAERERLFGQDNHVRAYGPDYLERLEEAGFAVEVISAADVVSADKLESFAIPAGEHVFFCRHP